MQINKSLWIDKLLEQPDHSFLCKVDETFIKSHANEVQNK